MRTPIVLALTLLALINAPAYAHFIWLEIPTEPANTAQMRFSEEPREATGDDLQEKAKPMTVKSAAGEAIAFAPGADALEAKLPEGTNLLGGSIVYGVLDKTAAGRGKFLLNYHAKAAKSPADAKNLLGSDTEITAEWASDTLHVQVLYKGAPAKEADVLLQTPGGKGTVERVTDGEGRAEFPLPSPGWIGLRALVTQTEAGAHEGQDYPQIRSYATLTVEVPAKTAS
jgi:uncharacterized GH25 family protein